MDYLAPETRAGARVLDEVEEASLDDVSTATPSLVLSWGV